MKDLKQVVGRQPLALVGIGCRLPGGVRDVESFWAMLVDGRSGITEVPDDRWNSSRYYHPDPAVPGRMSTKWGGFVDQLKSFDAAFWGISPREANRMDPQQRWLLETAWEALEDAGIPPRKLRGTNTGVFLGISSTDYASQQLHDHTNIDVHTNTGGSASIAANRVSYQFDFKGPSVAVDTACSSALVALSLACRAIWSGECEAALAGGVNALITPLSSIGFSKATMLSPCGECFAFDKRANGYVRGEGAGLVYLKPLGRALQDNDPVYAVIRAAVVNQDGHTSSMTIPGVESQSEMLRHAYREAGIPARQVVFVEAHGTGTPVGDPIEATALGNVLSPGRPDGETCLMGSVKTNIGHLESASGVAGLIKAALVLDRNTVPPNPNFKTPNPNIPFDKLRLQVAGKLQPLPHPNGAAPVVAVNSFGFGGTNAHVVLEASPPRPSYKCPKRQDADRPLVLPISARDDVSLRDYARAYRKSLEAESLGLSDFCYSSGARKEHHHERLVVVGRDARELRDRLNAWLQGGDRIEGIVTGRGDAEEGPIVFVFTGQGPQWWAMGRQLLEREPIVRQTIEEVDELFLELGGWSLIEEMTRPEEQSNINRTAVAQPAIFALQVALVELWKSWGIEPGRVLGHSMGEVAAAWCSGIFSLRDAVKLIYHRSRLQDMTAGSGRMLAAGITPSQARDAIGDFAEQVQLTAINSPDLVTLGGDAQPLETIAVKLEEEGRFVRWLRVNYAFHTHQMEPIKDELLDALAALEPRPSRIPFVSTVTGEVHPGDRLDATYWWHNVRRPVLFGQAVSNLIDAGQRRFLEIGPHPALGSSVRACLAARGTKGAVFHSLARKTDESLEMLTNLAGLHIASADVDWAAVNQSAGNFVRLPHYPWHYETYWLETGDMASMVAPESHPLLGRRITAAKPTWQFELDPRLFSYLNDHRIWDSLIFPAAGYGEIGLAVAGELFPQEPYVVEDIQSTNALFISEDAVPTVQVVFDDESKSFSVYSSTGEGNWERNARGRLVPSPSVLEPPGVELAEVRGGLADRIDHERYYAELHALGYQFGPDFSEIQRVWRVPGESLVEIAVPENLTESARDYRFHPAVLDACFQATHGARDFSEDVAATDFFYLPESIRRIQLYRDKLPSRIWAHARQRHDDGKSIASDILVYDDQGQRLADILGFRVAKVKHKPAADDIENCLYQFNWEPRQCREGKDNPREQADSSTAKAVRTRPPFVVFADERGVADALANRLEQRGDVAIQLRAGTEFRRVSETEFTLADGSADELRRVFSCQPMCDLGATAIVHCWSLDHLDARRLETDTLLKAQQTGVLSGLSLAKVLNESETPTPPRVYFVTRNAQSVVDNDGASGLASSPLIGFLRVANNELCKFHWSLVDLDEHPGESEADDLFNEISLGNEEHEVSFRGDRRYVNRFQRVRLEDLPSRGRNARQPDGRVVPYRLQIHKAGILDNLSLNETQRRRPQPNEIEVRVRAGGVNFRDVMKALGMYPGNPVDLLWFGDDFSGTVERVGEDVSDLKPGDPVVGITPYCFRSFVTVDRQTVFKQPPGMSFEEAATLPTVFLTSHFAIRNLARMEPGEKILIHAATGGVGQAAIQIARHLGLEIFATAGTPEKREMLKSLGVPHVMNSRTLEFADQIMDITDGAGVDAVLNSLAGEFIPKSLSVLAPFGRFLEIGKVDVYGNTKVGLAALKNNIAWHTIDLAQVLAERPACVTSILDELTERFATGDYGPLPHKVFPIAEVVAAFRFMAQGKHVGKVVLSFDEGPASIGPCTEEGHLLRSDASYLITGGAGGFGLEIAKWMASQGARNLLLMSRGGPREQAAADIEILRAEGVIVLDVRGDVTSQDDVQGVIDRIQSECPPLKGVVHAAMVLDDEFLTELDEDRFNRVLHPKMLGAWNLHLATRELPLDHFICFSSFSTAIGAAKQSNYNAGNCFLDALVQQRRALGLPGLSLNWGAVLGAGFVERNRKTAEYLDTVGLKSFRMDEALRIFREMIQRSAPLTAVGRVDWKQLGKFSPAVANLPTYAPVASERTHGCSDVSLRRRLLAAQPAERFPIVEDFLAEQVAGVFGIETANVDRTTPLTNLGLDSLMAVELMNRVESETGMNIPMGSVLTGPNVQELTRTVLDQLIDSTDAPEARSEDAWRSGGSQIPLKKADPQLDEFPLTVGQRASWSECRSTGHPHGNIACAAKVRRKVDVQKLFDAFKSVLGRHPMLRASISRVGDELTQEVRPLGDVDLFEQDVTQLNDRQLKTRIASRIKRPFDLESDSLVRLELFHCNDDADIVLLCTHSIVADARSTTIAFGDLIEAYRACCSGRLPNVEPAEYTYQDIAGWQREILASDTDGRMAEYWIEQLTGAPLSVNLPTDRPRKRLQTFREAAFGFELDDELTLRLLAFSAAEGVALRDTLFAAFALLVHRYSGQDDILIGYRLDGRGRPELRHLIGHFANWMPIRSRVEDDPAMGGFLTQTGHRLANCRENQQLPLSRLLDRLDMRHDPATPPLIQVAFAMQRREPADEDAFSLFQIGRRGHALNYGDLSLETIDVHSDPHEQLVERQSVAARNGSVPRIGSDLMIELGEACGKVLGWWRYNRELFQVDSVERMDDLYRRILEQIVADPTRSVSQLLPRTVDEKTEDATTRRATQTRRARPRATTRNVGVDLQRDIQLDPAIAPNGRPRVRPSTASRLFLTGATGFVGAFLLNELLDRTASEVVCLVRAPNEADGLRRIRQNLSAYDLSPWVVEQRVKVVIGDLSKRLLGLTQEGFDRLASGVDVIYHNGADVNLVLPYQALRSTNVCGTREVLRLACRARAKPTHVVSTFTVHTTEDNCGRVVTETDPLPPCEELLHGYSQTKWVAEKMIDVARRRGLPVAVYRPGHITGDSRTGAANVNDLLHTIVLACLRLGAVPRRDFELDLTPVDYVARAIVDLSLRPESLGHAFHLTNPNPLKTRVLTEWMERSDLEVELVSYDTWRDRLFDLADRMQIQTDELHLLADILVPRLLAEDDARAVHPRFDCRRTLNALANTDIRCPPVDERLLTIGLEYLQRTGVAPLVPRHQPIGLATDSA